MSGRSTIPRQYFGDGERTRIVAAIQAAERRTSGEIRVHIEREVPLGGDAYAHAREVFARLGMHATAARNGVLIYLAVKARRFAVVGDEGLHTHVGDAFWSETRDVIGAAFADDRPVEGIEAAISRIGERLREHFPVADDDVNELPDDISY